MTTLIVVVVLGGLLALLLWWVASAPPSGSEPERPTPAEWMVLRNPVPTAAPPDPSRVAFARSVRPGTTVGQVLDGLGPPTSRTSFGDYLQGTRWASTAPLSEAALHEEGWVYRRALGPHEDLRLWIRAGVVVTSSANP